MSDEEADPDGLDEHLVTRLQSFDEALRAGTAPTEPSPLPPHIPAAMEANLRRAQECLRLLEKAWPRRPAVTVTPGATVEQAAPGAAACPGPAGIRKLPQLPGYEILGELGRGGMGVVYRARDTSLGRLVALKMVRSAEHADPAELLRFLTEARAVAALQHPHIVPMYEIGQHDGLPYFTLEFVGGGSLSARLGQPLPPRDSARLTEQLARAVHHAHQMGLVHRDVKPANILLVEDRQTPLGRCTAKLTDFGLVKHVGGEGMTETGDVLGTPAYMAPEQAAGACHRVGPAADVYALGAVLYHMLTGRPPFQGQTSNDLLASRMSDEPVPPRRLVRGVPRDLDTICLKCLHRSADRRYASAAELAEDLRRYQAGEPIAARPVGAVERTAKWVRRRPAVAGLLILVLLVAVTGAVLVTWQWRAAVAALDDTRRERHERALIQVNALRDATPGAVPGVLADLEHSRADALPRLRELWAEGGDEGRRMRVALALMPVEPEAVREPLYRWLLKAEDPGEVVLACEALRASKENLIDDLWALANDDATPAPKRFRALVALATFDPAGGHWSKVGDTAVALLMRQNPFYHVPWARALRPVRAALLKPLSAVFRGKEPQHKQTAALVLADYLDDNPEPLVDLLLDADPRQYVALQPVVEQHRERAVELVRREVVSTGAAWTDAPVDPTWVAPAALLRQEVEKADGFFAERFALCQDLPLERVLPVTEGLRSSGYRPVRVRPWRRGQSLRMAIVWMRDGGDWRLDLGRTEEQVKRDVVKRAEEKFLPVDVADYGGLYATVWRLEQKSGQARFILGLTRDELRKVEGNLENQQLIPVTLHAAHGPDGRLRYSGVWRNWVNRPPSWLLYEDRAETNLVDAHFDAGRLPIDVHVHPAEPALPLEKRLTQLLEDVEAELAAKPDDLTLRLRRAEAMFRLGRNGAALAELNVLEPRAVEVSGFYRLRALANACAGHAEATQADLAAYARLVDPGRQQPGLSALSAVARAWVGAESSSLDQLESALLREPHNRDFFYLAAQVYAHCSMVSTQQNAAAVAAAVGLGPSVAMPAAIGAPRWDRPDRYTHRGLACLQQAVANGYNNFVGMTTDHSLKPLWGQAEFIEMLQKGHFGRSYSGVRQVLPGMEAIELHGLTPQAHLARCRELASLGYRPVALSVLAEQNGVTTTSVWHRPKLSTAQHELRAKRQAQAAAALLQLGDPESVWPLLRHSSQPEARAQLIWRAGLLPVDPVQLVRRLEQEPDASARRALILALGDFSRDRLPSEVRVPLQEKLLKWYRDDPDPGIHAAIDWLLRHGNEGLEPRPQDWGLAKKLASLDAAARQRDPDGVRRWYVNGQQQTMVLIPGPVQFRMGSPPDEPGRGPGERQTLRRIDRSYAIAAKLVTVEQFQRFLKDRPDVAADYNKDDSPEPECPIQNVSWYTAAQYCNWLSEKEHIPEAEWCYPKHGDIHPKMTLYPDYLRRTGYRLATEAEWEYACRAGAESSRYFGSSVELLPRYAWYERNGRGRTWPVGQKRPNDLGLFDMHGNLFSWVQDRNLPYPTGAVSPDNEDVKSTEGDTRVLRGGAFSFRPEMARSAYRYYSPPGPEIRQSYVGFRVARTWR